MRRVDGDRPGGDTGCPEGGVDIDGIAVSPRLGPARYGRHSVRGHDDRIADSGASHSAVEI
jgi:hypothetical protein